MTNHSYPRLKDITTIKHLPESLSFVQDGIDSLLEELFYRNFNVNHTDATTRVYTLDIIGLAALKLDIPGTGLAIRLNPSGSSVTAVPFSLTYRLGINKYFSQFDLVTFAYSAKAFYDLFIKVYGISKEALLLALKGRIKDAQALENLAQKARNAGATIPKQLDSDFKKAIRQIAEGSKDMVTGSLEDIAYADFLMDPQNLKNTWQHLQGFFQDLTGPNALAKLEALLVPQIRATLELSLGLEFPRKMLQPMKKTGDVLAVDPDPNKKAMVLADVGELSFDTQDGLDFDTGGLAFKMDPKDGVGIGQTGLTLTVTKMKVDLSRSKNIPEAGAAGYANDFTGVFIEEATVDLPSKWFRQKQRGAEIFAQALLAGTGGLTGKLGLRATGTAPDPVLKFTLGGAESELVIGFNKFDLEFHMNAIVASNIKGFLEIPGFKDANGNKPAKIEIEVHIGQDGDISITAKEADGIKLSIPKVFDLHLTSLAVGRKQNRLYLAIAGSLDFTFDLPLLKNKLPKGIEIQKLLIWDDGAMEFVGGGIALKKPFSLDIKPVKATISGMSFGSHRESSSDPTIPDRDYRFFGFDLDLSVKPGGVDLQGNGIKLFFREVDGDVDAFMRISGVAIDMTIPGRAKPEDAALLLSGFLSIEPAGDDASKGNEYAGGIHFTLPRLKMAGSATMRYFPRVPAFFIDIGLTLASPILLGCTNLGIYDFRAMLGLRYVATKKAAGLAEDAEWWRYYKAKVPPENEVGIQSGKFEQIQGFSLGAGVGLATVPDAGYSFSSQVLFLLSLPEVFLIQGQAQILSKRLKLKPEKEPPFFIFMAITKRSIEAAIGVNYLVPDKGVHVGKIARVDGLLELGFFFGNSSAWYINIGRDQPEHRRIRVKLFDLFEAYFYLMLSARGIRAGAGTSFHLKKKFGPLRAELAAYFRVAGRISFKPKQIGASIQVGGSVGLSIFRFGFLVTAQASLAAECPQPFIITGSLKACVRVLRKDRCAKFNLTWNLDKNPDLSPIKLLDDDPSKVVKAVNIATHQSFDLSTTTLPADGLSPPEQWINASKHVIPLDCFIDIEFKKGVHYADSEKQFGGRVRRSNHIEYVPPQKAKSAQVKHTFVASAIDIKYWDGEAWVPYDIYDAMIPLDGQPASSELFKGFWQMDKPGNYNKLRILSQTPFSYLTQNPGNTVVEDLGITTETVFCSGKSREKTCFQPNEIAVSLDGDLGNIAPNRLWSIGGALLRYLGKDGTIVARPHLGLDQPLGLLCGEKVEIYFKEPVACASLVLATIATSVTVSFDQRVDTGTEDSSGMPVFAYQSLASRQYTAKELHDPITNSNDETPFHRITVIAGDCPKSDAIDWFPVHRDDVDIVQLTSADPARVRQPGIPRIRASKLAPFVNGYHQGRITHIQDILAEDAKDHVFAIGSSNHQGWLAHMNRQGEILWQKNYRLANRRISFRHGLVCDNGDFLIYGHLAVANNRNHHLVVRLGRDGQIRWAQSYGHAASRFPSRMIAVGRDNFIISGWHDRTGNKDHIDLIKINGQGQILAARQIGTGGDDQLNNLIAYQGGCLMVGQTNQNGWGGFVAALDHNLDFRFQWKLENEHGSYVDAVLELPDGRLLIAGPTSIPGSPNLSHSYAGLINPANLSNTKIPNAFGAPVWDLLANQPENRSHILMATGKTYRLVTNPTNRQGRATVASLSNRFKLTGLFELDLDEGYRLAQLKTGLKRPAELWACGNLSAGDSERGLLLKTDSRFRTCKTRRLKRPKTTKTRFEVVRWQAKSQPLAIEAMPLRLEPKEAEARKESLCPDPCKTNEPSSFLYQVCYETEADVAYNESLPTAEDVAEDNQKMGAGLEKTIQPIWRPDTYFAIRVATEDKLSVKGKPKKIDYLDQVFGFKTAGGIGHFHVQALKSELPEARKLDIQAKLSDFTHYIDYGRSYPNADGRRTNAKPLFYGSPELRLFFRQPYVHAMFNDWKVMGGLGKVEASMEVLIKDPLDEPDKEPSVPRLAPDWKIDDKPSAFLPEDMRVLSNMIHNSNPCSEGVSFTPQESSAVVDIPPDTLLPSKTYNAIFNAVMKRPGESEAQISKVHHYAFETSRYANFAEQIESYHLQQDMIDAEGKTVTVSGKACFEVARAFSASDLQKAGAVLHGTETDDQKKQYAHPFDRLIDGALALGDLWPAMTTEVNIIRRENHVLGILLRNPEPFNDPKIPLDLLPDTLDLIGPGDYQFLFSKDLSRVFITSKSQPLNMSPGRYELVFNYLQFDGLQYQIEATVRDVFFEIS